MVVEAGAVPEGDTAAVQFIVAVPFLAAAMEGLATERLVAIAAATEGLAMERLAGITVAPMGAIMAVITGTATMGMATTVGVTTTQYTWEHIGDGLITMATGCHIMPLTPTRLRIPAIPIMGAITERRVIPLRTLQIRAMAMLAQVRQRLQRRQWS